ncbi:hypothetical protein D918_02509 [Trichuris suis]|nr:hypothetical protein D918_02509 [Trichuris suis]
MPGRIILGQRQPVISAALVMRTRKLLLVWCIFLSGGPAMFRSHGELTSKSILTEQEKHRKTGYLNSIQFLFPLLGNEAVKYCNVVFFTFLEMSKARMKSGATLFFTLFLSLCCP